MARIRIVDEWLRSPVSSPSRYRAIMVVADRWGEQRVLMRAYQESSDQTRPTIVLHGEELAFGPAGTDPHGPWGIHVRPPVDGRAQELRGQLELAAKRLAGARGNAPRLEDEASRFEGKRTNYWAPGVPQDRSSQNLGGEYYEPAVVAPPSASTIVPSAARRPTPVARSVPRTTPVPHAAAPRRRRGWTSPVPMARAREVGSRTAAGFAGGPMTSPRRSISRPATPAPVIAKLVGKTMPVGLQLSDAERTVINALGAAPLTARRVGQLASSVGDAVVEDGVAWMEQLMLKLSGLGIDIIEPGLAIAGEPTYMLRR